MMLEFTSLLTILFFLLTVTFVMWRPKGINEAIPATIGAVLVFMTGSVSLSDLGQISETISGAAITIMATIVMAIVLESFGFFTWAAEVISESCKRIWFKAFLVCQSTLLFNDTFCQ